MLPWFRPDCEWTADGRKKRPKMSTEAGGWRNNDGWGQVQTGFFFIGRDQRQKNKSEIKLEL